MERTVHFLEGWRALDSATPGGGADRIRRLVDGVRPLLLRNADLTAEAAPALPSPVAIRRLFGGLELPLAKARSAGSFIDIWSVAGVRRKELPNAAVLAWLIDPRGSHGQSTLCLSALLDSLIQPSSVTLSGLALDGARVQLEERPLGSDRDRVDIVVETPDLLIFIEVKIDAAEGQAQLSRYVESAARVAAVRAATDGGVPKRTLIIFLSPRPPLEVLPEVAHITWREFSAALTTASSRAEGLAGVLIRSFAAHTRSFG